MNMRKSASSARRVYEAEARQPIRTPNETRSADVRVAAMEKLVEVDESVLATVQDIFDGTGLVDDQRAISHLLMARAEIMEHWSKSRASFLAIGRALISVERNLSEEQSKRLQDATDRIFPFSKTVATMLRQNARMVEDRRLTEAELPASYTTAYQISRLSVVELAEARRRGLIHSEVQRPAIMRFRRDFRFPTTLDDVAEQELPRMDRAQLHKEHTALAQQRRKMIHDFISLRNRMNAITNLLDT